MRRSQEDTEVLKSFVAQVKKEAEDRSTCYTPSTAEDPYRTPQRGTTKRMALHRGSPVSGNVFREDPGYYRSTGLYEQSGNSKWGVPKNKDTMLSLAKFSAKETCKGLGTGIND
jgi:hypothetical protein